MKRTIAIIALSIIIALLVTFIICSNISSKQQLDKKTKELNIEIDKWKDQSKQIKTIIKYLPQKEKEIIEVYVNDSEKIIFDLQKQLSIALSRKIIKHDISLFILGGITQEVRFDVYAGAIYRHFWNFRIASVHLGAGGAVKIYDKLGAGIVLECGIGW